MYAFFAFIASEWQFVGMDPHEECAVMFIDTADRIFGDGTAQVFKLPNKEGHTPLGDQIEHQAGVQDMQSMIAALEKGEIDLDTALKNLNK